MKSTDPKKFNPWPYAIVIYLVVFFLCTLGLVAFASRNKMDLVEKDYYDKEIRYQEHINSQSRANTLSDPARMTLQTATHTAVFALPASHVAQHAIGQLHLYRPDNSRLDRSMDVPADGTLVLNTTPLADGFWRWELEWKTADQNYLLSGQFTMKH